MREPRFAIKPVRVTSDGLLVMVQVLADNKTSGPDGRRLCDWYMGNESHGAHFKCVLRNSLKDFKPGMTVWQSTYLVKEQ